MYSTLKLFSVSILMALINCSWLIAQPAIFSPEPNPHRGMYVDYFVSVHPSNLAYKPAFSILGVDLDNDGIFEKEVELLEYCRDNHITSLTLYNLRNFIGREIMVWDQNAGSMLDLEDHLCRFMTTAREDYCVDEINASEENSFHREFNFMANLATPPISLSSQFKADVNFDPLLLLMEDATLVPPNPLFYMSELLKFYHRTANLSRRTSCSSYFNYISVDYEYWHSQLDDYTDGFVIDLSCSQYICDWTTTIPALVQPGNPTPPNPPDLFGRPLFDGQGQPLLDQNGYRICEPCDATTYPSAYSAKYFSHFKPRVRALRSLVDNHNQSNGFSSTDIRYLKTQAYVQYLNISGGGVPWESYETRGDMVRFFDGTVDFDPLWGSESNCPLPIHYTSPKYLDRNMIVPIVRTDC